MTTPGEKFHYVVALLDAFVAELPATWTIGFLYDIACQVHLSAVKHGLFPTYMSRLRFAVSVFHAFGHDWPCQLIYHPRKRVGFGLSDGEGCERFWYSISKLIPYLRVAGYHVRLQTLNSQFAHNTQEALKTKGGWIARKARAVVEKETEARALLAECGDMGSDPEEIRRQWQDQGRSEVEQALELLHDSKEALSSVKAAEAVMRKKGSSPDRVAAVEAAKVAHKAAVTRYERKTQHLGVPAKARLRAILDDPVLHLRMNALVLLRRIQSSIVKRKMELERVVRAHRGKAGEHQLRKHTKSAVQRREHTVRAQVNRYNASCKELATKIAQPRRQRGSCCIRALQELPTQGLWTIDVDDPCWDDLRFESEDDATPPLWLAEPDMRKAIRAQLVIDRCAEEVQRLDHERGNLRAWFALEWQALGNARRDSVPLMHALNERRRTMLAMAIQWKRSGLLIEGPTDIELMVAESEWKASSCDLDLDAYRKTRTGKVYCSVLPLPITVDLDALFQEATADETDEEPPHSGTDGESDLTSLPSSRASSPDGGQAAPLLPAFCPATTTAGGHNSKARKRNRRRQQKRESADASLADGVKRRRAEKILEATEEEVEYDWSDARVTSTGFTTLREAGVRQLLEDDDLKDFKYLDWNGRDPIALTVGEEGTVVAVLGGCPPGPDWETQHRQLAREMEESAADMTFCHDDRHHRRGNFRAKAHGHSHGGGQKRPGPLSHSKNNKAHLDHIIQLPSMVRLSHHSAGMFSNWFPKVAMHYENNNSKLFKWRPSLCKTRNFPRSPWSCTTFNFGPRTATFPHRDFGNLSFGICAITALGRFNPDRGGHLVLKELRIVIRFPAGSTVLIPSALLTHANTDIAPDERRMSVTQYSAGALFRWVAQGCQLSSDYYKGFTKSEKAKAVKEAGTAWRTGRAMLLTMEELVLRAQVVADDERR
ncbi:hypothetical protein BD626DRAFT_406758 [Schizophyllum amplum]|uniref:Uncharacterized protein n=1 Tax=Schizophyllum amplum TaxID=97359 RepID=A0A550C801_9AGAR|nr:hypothetical protein BD626DRAFT_406758 [Auriculariopsis ampla]